jgi:hypothetical protein
MKGIKPKKNVLRMGRRRGGSKLDCTFSIKRIRIKLKEMMTKGRLARLTIYTATSGY